MPDRTDWKRLIESYNFAADHIALWPTVAKLGRRKGGETGAQRRVPGCPSIRCCEILQVQTSSTGQSRSHRPGSLEHGDLEYGDFWSWPHPPSLENMLAAKNFLIDRAVFASSTGQS